MYRRIAYLSEWVGDTSDESLAVLGYSSNSRNSKKGIGSILHYNKSHVLQVIEGSESIVRELMEKITRDKRHTKIVVLLDAQLQEKTILPAMAVRKPDECAATSDCLNVISNRVTAIQEHLLELNKPERIRKSGPHCRVLIQLTSYDLIDQNHCVSSEIIELVFNVLWKISRHVSQRPEYSNFVFNRPTGTRLNITAPVEDTQLSLFFCQQVNSLTYRLLRTNEELDIPRSLLQFVSEHGRHKFFYVVPVFSISCGVVSQTSGSATRGGFLSKMPLSISHVFSDNGNQLHFATPERPILISKEVYERSSRTRQDYQLLDCVDFISYSVSPRDSLSTVPLMSRGEWKGIREKLIKTFPGSVKTDSYNYSTIDEISLKSHCKELLEAQAGYMSETPSYLKHEHYPVSDPDLRSLFKSLDIERCGYLSKEDLREYCYAQDTIGLDQFKEKQIETALSECHLLGPKLVSYEEFCTIVLKFAQR